MYVIPVKIDKDNPFREDILKIYTMFALIFFPVMIFAAFDTDLNLLPVVLSSIGTVLTVQKNKFLKLLGFIFFLISALTAFGLKLYWREP